MSSFFNNRQPAMFDAKKKLGTLSTSGSSTSSGERPPLPLDEAESTSGFPASRLSRKSSVNTAEWVELAPSRGSLCSSVEAVMIERDNSGENTGTKDSRLSPVSSLQSPHVEFESNLQQVKDRLVKDMLPPGKNTDWIWDWSSRPEAAPPKMTRHRSGQIGSTLTTPPNSPEPENSDAELSFFEYRMEKSKKSVFLRFEVIVGLVVSNIVTFFIGATLGFCVCKKLAKSHSAELH
jgi:hypothetical protein